MKMVRTYSLEWLDSLISVTLHPDKPYRQKLSTSEILSHIEKVPVETNQVQRELTMQIFALNKDSQVRHLVAKYHSALINLRDAIIVYRENPGFVIKELLGLDTIILNCLQDLIFFIENRYAAYVPGVKNDGFAAAKKAAISPDKITTDRHKVICTLSADQIALILRAADESQVLKARSMNAVFKFIIPYLSTPHKENLSAAAVRSKAYNPEEADRDAAVDALQKIIKKIQGY